MNTISGAVNTTTEPDQDGSDTGTQSPNQRSVSEPTSNSYSYPQQQQTQPTMRIYDPRKCPMHSYYKQGDIVVVKHGKYNLIGVLQTPVLANNKSLSEKNPDTTTGSSSSSNHYYHPNKKCKQQQQQQSKRTKMKWKIRYIQDNNQLGTKGKTANHHLEEEEEEATVTTKQIHPFFGCQKVKEQQQHFPQIIITYSTDYFRQLASTLCDINEHDKILELGCSTGETSRLLWKRGVKAWIGFDTSKQMIDKMQTMIENDTGVNSGVNSRGVPVPKRRKCVCMNLLSSPGAALDLIADCFDDDNNNNNNNNNNNGSSSSSIGPTVVFLDIGGNREELVVIRMLLWILHTQQTQWTELRLILVKSQEIVESLLLPNNNDNCYCHPETGVVVGNGGHDWLQHRLHVLQQQKEKDPTHNNNNNINNNNNAMILSELPKHPLKATERYRPVGTGSNDPKVLICRYHNYHPKGCLRYQDESTECPYDHEFCHMCLERGHIARQCPFIQQQQQQQQQEKEQPRQQ